MYPFGLITILLYAYQGGVIEAQHSILTENLNQILTEDSKVLLIES